MKVVEKKNMSMLRRRWLVIPIGFALVTMTSCVALRGPAPPVAESPYVAEDYTIGPEDTLEIFVLGRGDLSRVVTVRPDGKISLPLV